jgi:hypothetical protein
MNDILITQLRSDGAKSFTFPPIVLNCIGRIEGDISQTPNGSWTRLWFEDGNKQPVWTAVASYRGRIEIEAI